MVSNSRRSISIFVLAFIGLTSQSALADDNTERFSGLFQKGKLSRDCFAEAGHNKDDMNNKGDENTQTEVNVEFGFHDINLLTTHAQNVCTHSIYNAPRELTIWGLETLYVKSKRLSAAYSILKEVNNKVSNNEKVDCLTLIKGLSAMCPKTMSSIHKTVAPE